MLEPLGGVNLMDVICKARLPKGLLGVLSARRRRLGDDFAAKTLAIWPLFPGCSDGTI